MEAVPRGRGYASPYLELDDFVRQGLLGGFAGPDERGDEGNGARRQVQAELLILSSKSRCHLGPEVLRLDAML